VIYKDRYILKMDRSTPFKSGAKKQSDADHKKDSDEGESIGAPFPLLPFWMEKRPRGGRKKKAAAEAKAATNEANKAGNECDKAKEPLKTEQKVASKFKPGTLRWGETVLEAGLNDPTSYLLGTMTHATQAEKHPDFIGDAFYYNLTNRAVSNHFIILAGLVAYS
jgi:hypothetical protein